MTPKCFLGGSWQQPGLPWERQKFRLPKALPATGKMCNFGVFWTCSDAYSSGCSAWGCAKTYLFYLQSAGSQLAETRSKTCRSHCISQRSSLCSPAGPTVFPNRGCPADKAGSSAEGGSCREPTTVAGDGSGSKCQWLGRRTGKSQTGLLSCHHYKPSKDLVLLHPTRCKIVPLSSSEVHTFHFI